MSEFIWRAIARIVSKPRIADAIIRYAKLTPYCHLPSDDCPTYMERYWVFNPYDRVTNKPRFSPLIPVSIRVHHIIREDFERALHDHPWNARTIILKGWYIEKRFNPEFESMLPASPSNPEFVAVIRRPGDTARLRFGEFHTIVQLSDDDTYTLFFSWKWRGVWGFLVDGVKVPWRKYLGVDA